MTKTIQEQHAEFEPPFFAGEKIPYVLFERPLFEWKGGKKQERQELTCMHLSGSAGTKGGIQYYIEKPGWKVVDYWLPDHPRFNELRAFLSGWTGRADKRVLELEEQLKAINEEKSAFEAKIRELEKVKEDGSEDRRGKRA